ncbi:hypothetical protein PIB30_058725 [Stylosanthes scabra]|uniref:Uncharacterized protein n=1 Tax=Stylosanthes scabra TaxID=79078 RepID=A0ABU6TMG8_9FABA|nr:hypothetical protein [Stylosanthes scabra]
MESDGAASSRRRSGGGGVRSEHSSSTQGVYVPRVERIEKELLRSVTAGSMQYPTYQEQRTTLIACSSDAHSSSRQLTIVSLFQGRLPHCKFFMWLDVFTAKITNDAAGKIGEEEQDVREQFGRIELEKLIHDLENRVAMLEKKNHMNLFYIITMFVVLVFAYFVNFG